MSEAETVKYARAAVNAAETSVTAGGRGVTEEDNARIIDRSTNVVRQ